MATLRNDKFNIGMWISLGRLLSAARTGILSIEKISVAILTTLAFGSVMAAIAKAIDPQPVYLCGLVIDRMTTCLGILVALIGVVVVQFSFKYMEGDAKRTSFIGWLLVGVLSSAVLMLSNHLIVLFGAWLCTSVALHQLLTHYSHRREALLAARKKFLYSRLGDAMLIGVLGIAYFGLKTLHLDQVISDLHTPLSPQLAMMAGLVTVAALSKSAQFPFHTWLPDTMEAPTPVSALMHGGIINGGGVLLLKFSPLLVRVPIALVTLSVIGSLTMVIGALTMGEQSSVKRKLAWSTVGQMGFMTAECGIGAFTAALLHILAHAVFKANLFLRASSLPNRASSQSRAGSDISLGRKTATFAFGCSFGWIFLSTLSHVLPIPHLDHPVQGLIALTVGQIWLKTFPHNSAEKIAKICFTIGLAAGFTMLADAIYLGLEHYFGQLFPSISVLGGSWSGTGLMSIAKALPIATVAFLMLAELGAESVASSPWIQRMRIHQRNGFYLGILSQKLIKQVWPVQLQGQVK